MAEEKSAQNQGTPPVGQAGSMSQKQGIPDPVQTSHAAATEAAKAEEEAKAAEAKTAKAEAKTVEEAKSAKK